MVIHNENVADRLSDSEPTASSLPGGRSAAQMIEEQVVRGERTLTRLGMKLLEARRRIEQSGIPLLTDVALEREKAERRGGVPDA